MKILVYGAGVLGSLYAAKLNGSGNDVTILARGQRFHDIRTNGVILRDDTNGEMRTLKIPVIAQLEP